MEGWKGGKQGRASGERNKRLRDRERWERERETQEGRGSKSRREPDGINLKERVRG